MLKRTAKTEEVEIIVLRITETGIIVVRAVIIRIKNVTRNVARAAEETVVIRTVVAKVAVRMAVIRMAVARVVSKVASVTVRDVAKDKAEEEQAMANLPLTDKSAVTGRIDRIDRIDRTVLQGLQDKASKAASLIAVAATVAKVAAVVLAVSVRVAEVMEERGIDSAINLHPRALLQKLRQKI